jgi:hypothetical protein
MSFSRSGWTAPSTIGTIAPRIFVLGNTPITDRVWKAHDTAKVCEFGSKSTTGQVSPITANSDCQYGVHVFFCNAVAAGSYARVAEITDETRFLGQMVDINYQNAIGTRCNIAVTSNVAYLEANTAGVFEVTDVAPVLYPLNADFGTAQANGLVEFKVIDAAIAIAPAAVR